MSFWIQTYISRYPDAFKPHKGCGVFAKHQKQISILGTYCLAAVLVLPKWCKDCVSLREGGNTACLTRSKSITPVRRNSWASTLHYLWTKLRITCNFFFLNCTRRRVCIETNLNITSRGHIRVTGRDSIRKLSPFGQAGCHGDWRGLELGGRKFDFMWKLEAV